MIECQKGSQLKIKTSIVAGYWNIAEIKCVSIGTGGYGDIISFETVYTGNGKLFAYLLRKQSGRWSYKSQSIMQI